MLGGLDDRLSVRREDRRRFGALRRVGVFDCVLRAWNLIVGLGRLFVGIRRE